MIKKEHRMSNYGVNQLLRNLKFIFQYSIFIKFISKLVTLAKGRETLFLFFITVYA